MHLEKRNGHEVDACKRSTLPKIRHAIRPRSNVQSDGLSGLSAQKEQTNKPSTPGWYGLGVVWS